MAKLRTLPAKETLALLALIVLGVVAMVVIAIVLRPKQTPPPTAQSDAVTYSTDQPDEEKPGDNYKWKGAADEPQKIIMPSIGVDNFIQKVGVDQNKQVAVPNNIHLAGWFVDTVKPGQKGLSILDGHVNGRKNDGIFKDLDKVKEGDKFQVQLGDGSMKNFEVTAIKIVPLNDAANVLFSQDAKTESQLNLITCVGTYDKNARTYDKRAIVTARLVSGS